jgi:hypothetical protein
MNSRIESRHRSRHDDIEAMQSLLITVMRQMLLSHSVIRNGLSIGKRLA